MGLGTELADIRTRRARTSDAGFIAWAILSAARGHHSLGTWDFIWGFQEEELLEFLEALTLSETSHWCHHSRFTLAEGGEGRVVGALSAFDPQVDGPSALAPVTLQLAMDFGLSGEELLRCMANAEIVRGALPEYRDGVWAIENVACLPEYRGQGVVSALLRAARAEALIHGVGQLQANVFSDNVAAQRAYGAAGFELDEELRSEAFETELGSPGMQRLVAPVN